MPNQRITIELPEGVFQKLDWLAKAMQQPIETLVVQSIASNLPPSVERLPSELQAEILNLQTLNDDSLLTVAQSQVEPTQHQQHAELLAKNNQGSLTLEEQEQLTQLRQANELLMLRKAFAWSLLRWRGHRIPALNELPVPV